MYYVNAPLPSDLTPYVTAQPMRLAVLGGTESLATQWSFFEGRGSNLTAGMQGFSSGNLFPEILPPILKIVTHSASRNLWTLVVWVGCQILDHVYWNHYVFIWVLLTKYIFLSLLVTSPQEWDICVHQLSPFTRTSLHALTSWKGTTNGLHPRDEG